MGAQQTVDGNRLVITDQRNYAEANRAPALVDLVLGLLGGRSYERGDGQGLLAIDLFVAARSRNVIRDQRRPYLHAAGIAKGFHTAVVRNHVAELYDLRHAPEMFDQAGGSPKGLTRQVIDGNLAIVKVRIGNSVQVL